MGDARIVVARHARSVELMAVGFMMSFLAERALIERRELVVDVQIDEVRLRREVALF